MIWGKNEEKKIYKFVVKIIAKRIEKDRRRREIWDSTIDTLKDVIHEAPKRLFIVKG